MNEDLDTGPGQARPIELVWGAREIAKELNCDQRKAFHLLAMGQIPGAKKVGGSWVAERGKLREFFLGE